MNQQVTLFGLRVLFHSIRLRVSLLLHQQVEAMMFGLQEQNIRNRHL